MTRPGPPGRSRPGRDERAGEHIPRTLRSTILERASPPAMASVAQALRRAAQINPHGAAAITYRGSGGATTITTYAELLRTANRLARALRRALAAHEPPMASPPRIALLCRNHELALAYLFAIASIGAIAVPLNTRWAATDVTAALRDCDPMLVACDADLWPLLHDALTSSASSLHSLRHVILLYAHESRVLPLLQASGRGHASIGCQTHEAFVGSAAGQAEEGKDGRGDAGAAGGRGDDVQCLVYTSGSTGEPKGVMLSHGAQLVQALEKIRLGQYGPGTVYLSLAPLFHVAGLNSSVAITLAGGAHVFLHKPGGARGLGGADLALGAIAACKVDTLVVVPTMLAALLDAMDKAGGASDASSPCGSVAFVLVGGQALTERLWQRARRHMPRARLVQSYACSEACSSITFLELDPRDPFPAPGAVGTAATPVEVAILAINDDEKESGTVMTGGPRGRRRQRRRLVVTEPGVVGEIATRGPHVMRGYWGRPEATAAALVEAGAAAAAESAEEEHKEEGDGQAGPKAVRDTPWLCTGDLGAMDAQGRLRLVGRLADVIRSGGEKVMATEVERALKRHPRVLDAAVVGAPDPRFGERVVAFVVVNGAEGPGAVKEEGLRAFCRDCLAGYKVPREIRLVAALPLTGSGKVMKAKLRSAL